MSLNTHQIHQLDNLQDALEVAVETGFASPSDVSSLLAQIAAARQVVASLLPIGQLTPGDHYTVVSAGDEPVELEGATVLAKASRLDGGATVVDTMGQPLQDWAGYTLKASSTALFVAV